VGWSLEDFFQGRDAMLHAIWTRVFGFSYGISRAIYHAAPWTKFFCGAGAGWILLALFQQFLSQLGCSSPVISAVWCMTGAALTLAWGRSTTAAANDTDRQNYAASPSSADMELQKRGMSLISTINWRDLVHPALLVILVVVAPTIWNIHESALSDASLSSVWVLFCYALAWACLMLGIPVWCVARLSLTAQSGGFTLANSISARRSPSSSFLGGVAFGILAAPAFSFGNLYVASILASVLVICTQFMLIRAPLANLSTADANPGSALSNAGNQQSSSVFNWSVLAVCESTFITFACGGLLVWLVNVVGLLMVLSLFTFAALVAGTLIGVAIGFRYTSPSAAGRRRQLLWGSISMLASTGMLTAGFTLVVFRLVTLSGSVSQVWLLQGMRDIFVAALTIPLGFVWAIFYGVRSTVSNGNSGSQQAASRFSPAAMAVASAFVGGLLIQCWMIPAVGLSATSCLLLFGIAGISLAECLWHAELPRYALSRGVLAACCLAIVSAPFLSSGIRPEFASRLLFSTNVYIAERSGIPRTQLPFLDDSRLNQVQMSEHGVISVWKSAVSRFQIRENGIPRGIVSTNGAIAPQSSAEILISLLPLTLHEAPTHVAVLGIGAGVPMYTCLGSSDIGVTLVESDLQLVSVVKQLTMKTDLEPLWRERRLNHVQVDPALWVTGRGQQFDVVISNPDQSALLRSASLYTQEFYRRAARRLTPEGIFCQRFAFHDFGPGPIQTLSATLRSVFTNVMAVEIGPGEMAFIATNSENGLIRPGVAERMHAIYATEAMASIGWDWTVMLTLAAYDSEHLDKIEALGNPRRNSARNGWFCTQLPPELMRWGPKSAEISQVLAKNGGKILNWLGEVADREELLRRLSEVRGQQELLSNYPDQYWAYRSQVRKQVSTRPLTSVQKVKHEDGRSGLPPEDKRRLRYFQQLSKAIHSKKLEEFQRLETFTVPYDPLVSLFVHQELAEIAARAPEIDSQLELEHRLHTLFFTSTNDRSVRNGLAAVRLVLDKPETVTSETARFDLLNTLLQSLQYRWESRSTSVAGNAKELARDVEDNIVLTERALIVLTDLAPAAGISSSNCEARIRVIERKLLHPLRTYRAVLEPHVARQKLSAQEAELDGDLPTDEELKFPGADKDA
jgi:spermidine synthase